MRKLIAVVAVLGSPLLTGARCGSGAKGGDNVDPNRYVNPPSSTDVARLGHTQWLTGYPLPLRVISREPTGVRVNNMVQKLWLGRLGGAAGAVTAAMAAAES